jgi:DNA-binding response OmpR family regulator
MYNFYINYFGKLLIVIVQSNTITPDNKKLVLVVDDEPDIGLVLKLVLEKNGYIVDYYYNPVIALYEYKSNFYDLIILDIKMSYLNGFQLYREIRKKDINSNICLMTAGEMIYDIRNKFCPVYNFIKKPIENEELIRTINNLVNK